MMHMTDLSPQRCLFPTVPTFFHFFNFFLIFFGNCGKYWLDWNSIQCKWFSTAVTYNVCCGSPSSLRMFQSALHQILFQIEFRCAGCNYFTQRQGYWTWALGPTLLGTNGTIWAATVPPLKPQIQLSPSVFQWRHRPISKRGKMLQNQPKFPNKISNSISLIAPSVDWMCI